MVVLLARGGVARVRRRRGAMDDGLGDGDGSRLGLNRD